MKTLGIFSILIFLLACNSKSGDIVSIDLPSNNIPLSANDIIGIYFRNDNQQRDEILSFEKSDTGFILFCLFNKDNYLSFIAGTEDTKDEYFLYKSQNNIEEDKILELLTGTEAGALMIFIKEVPSFSESRPAMKESIELKSSQSFPLVLAVTTPDPLYGHFYLGTYEKVANSNSLTVRQRERLDVFKKELMNLSLNTNMLNDFLRAEQGE